LLLPPTFYYSTLNPFSLVVARFLAFSVGPSYRELTHIQSSPQ
jgi:hypothetical protein